MARGIIRFESYPTKTLAWTQWHARKCVCVVRTRARKCVCVVRTRARTCVAHSAEAHLATVLLLARGVLLCGERVVHGGDEGVRLVLGPKAASIGRVTGHEYIYTLF